MVSIDQLDITNGESKTICLYHDLNNKYHDIKKYIVTLAEQGIVRYSGFTKT